VYLGLFAVVATVASCSTRQKIKGRGNYVKFRGAILKRCVIDICGSNNRVDIAPECVLSGVLFRVRGDGNTIKIGARSQIVRGAELYCEDTNGTLNIGEHVAIQWVHIAVTEGGRVDVGHDSLFAYDVDIRNGDSHSIYDGVSGERLNFGADVLIGERVWIGVGAKILKGVSIGRDSVVATGAVVTKSVPDQCIVAGNPARVVRDNIRWSYDRNAQNKTFCEAG
jgi:acetyltransferase-like isoleucine patch superfamily enzyme